MFESSSRRTFGDQYTVEVGAEQWPEDRVGGKANGLHQLVRHGFSVPDAFCVVTDAFEAAKNRCIDAAADLDDLRMRLTQVAVPDALVAEIERRMNTVGADRWAVRSSALDEDDFAHSFAGQQDTVLGVQTVAEVVDAVRRVWASLYDIHGLLYRNRLRVGLTPRPMAVIIQRMVSPSVAGVFFTQNPVTGDQSQVVINAARGAGTSVVEGGPADTYYLEASTGYLERHEVGKPRGGDDADRSAALTADQIDQLADCARRIGQVFGSGRDVEWAYAPESKAAADSGLAGKLMLLQARPITAPPSQAGGGRAESVWTNVNVGESLPGVATPLTWSIIQNFSRRGFERAFKSLGLNVPDDCELVGSFRGRVYLNLTQFMSIASAIPLLAPDTLFEMAGGGGVDLVRDIHQTRSSAKFLMHLPLTAVQVVASQVSMPWVARLWAAFFGRQRDTFFDRDLSRLSHGQLCSQLEAVDRLFDRTGRVMLGCSSNFLLSYVVMRQCLQWWGGREAAKRENQLVSALDVDSAEPGRDLLNLGRLARRSRRLRRVITEVDSAEALEQIEQLRGHDDVDIFLDELAVFRRRHGHRAPREAELATPRWRENTQFLFEVIRNYVQASRVPSERQLRRDLDQTRQAADTLVERTFPAGLQAVFRGLLGLTRGNAKLREFMRARVVDALDMYRRFFLECGRRLALQQAVGQPDDVFYLRHDELDDWLDDGHSADDFATRVLVRRAVHAALDQLADPPSTFVLDGNEMVAEQDYRQRQNDEQATGRPADSARIDRSFDEINGLPGSGGKVSGRARVIVDPNEHAGLQPGEILVAPYTDVGWTPLFLTASAVVMGLGGPLSHSCIVAREYGIPAVVNAHGVTDAIATGDLITVDGDRGLVRVRRPTG